MPVLAIIQSVPFGLAVEVDKGFLIENVCVLLGIGCVNLMKLLEKQSQQSLLDAAPTQKIGKTQIVIEQNNGQMK